MNPLLLFAQEVAAPAAEAAGTDATKPAANMGPFGNPMFMFLILGLFVLTMIILPARRQKKEQQLMMANLKRGAKIVTGSGVIGTIVSIKDTEDEVTIRSEDTKMKITKGSIVRVLGQDEAEAAK